MMVYKKWIIKKCKYIIREICKICKQENNPSRSEFGSQSELDTNSSVLSLRSYEKILFTVVFCFLD